MMYTFFNAAAARPSYQAPDFAVWSVAPEQGFAESLTWDDSDMQGTTSNDSWGF